MIEEFLTGTHGIPDPDRCLATVLFTDIVGSTQKADQLGDRAWGTQEEDRSTHVAALPPTRAKVPENGHL